MSTTDYYIGFPCLPLRMNALDWLEGLTYPAPQHLKKIQYGYDFRTTVARRPKASVLDLVDTASNVGLNAAQLRRQAKLSRELEDVRRQHEIGTQVTLQAIGGLYDLHLANGHKLSEIESKLDVLSNISWNINSYFDRQEQRQEFIGIMRFYIHSTNRKLDEIDGYSEDYPEYALLEVNKILNFIKEKDVRVEHFQLVSVDEMRYAQELLDRVYETKKSLLERM